MRAITMGIDMPVNEPFRLLDLPREVRDGIYYGMLCDWRQVDTRGQTLLDGRVRFAPMHLRIETNILLANKQIYQEAKLVLLKGNQFVHIRMVVRDRYTIRELFFPSHIPLVAVGRDCGAVFKDLVVMKHFIEFAKDSASLLYHMCRFDVIVLHRDLPQFCKAVTMLDMLGNYSVQSKHQVTIHNPFVKTLSPDFLNSKNQERLLEPYAREFQGFGHFNIDGHVQPDLAESVAARIRAPPPVPDPNTFLEDLLHEKELGDQALHDGDQQEAIRIWKGVTFQILQASNRRTWLPLKTAGGKYFTDRVSELAFQIESDQAQRSLEAMRPIPLQIQISEGRSFFVHVEEEEEDKPGRLRRHMEHLARVLQVACFDAERVGTVLGTDWTPGNEQLARLCYSVAQGLRLVEWDFDLAEHEINRAGELVPDDPLIESEAQQIRVWKARVQGG